MRKRLPALIASICILLTEGIALSSEADNHLPPETIVLNLPDSPTNWKEISRCVTEKEGLVEYIPLDQQIENWSELICFQYLDKFSMGRQARNSIEDTLDLLRESTLASYPGNKVTWRIIEKNKTDAIYEWILHKPYKNIAPEHDVSRIFLTNTGLHRISLTRKNREMSSVEKKQWIKSLKDSVSLISTEKAQKSAQGLSLIDRLKGSLDLGEAFADWKVVNTYAYQTGYTIVAHVPPSFNGGYIAECLEVTTMPNVHLAAINRLFEIEKEGIQKKSPKKIEFHLLKQADKEVIYSFVYPQDNLQVTGVVRSFLAEPAGYYSISYKRGLPRELKPKEVQLWKTRLEAVKTCKDLQKQPS